VIYINTATNTSVSTLPPLMRGGILADDVRPCELVSAAD
jgi:hypothetical protein